jgi:anti-sigma B factor antagonist
MARPPRIEIRETREGEKLTVSVEGELDLGTIPALAQHIDARTDSDDGALTLDLGGVTFMDSSGLRMLIELTERSQRQGWELSLIAPEHQSATLVLRMTGADQALPFEGRSAP